MTKDKEKIIIQSKKLLHGVLLFIIILQYDLTYQAFPCGASCVASSLAFNNIYKCKTGSASNKAICY